MEGSNDIGLSNESNGLLEITIIQKMICRYYILNSIGGVGFTMIYFDVNNVI